MKQIHIKLSESLHRELRIQAAIEDQTMQNYVIKAIREKIDSDKTASSLRESTEESASRDMSEQRMG